MITSAKMAREIAKNFDDIKERGGHAAIDYCNGEIALRCTMPTSDPKTWGGAQCPSR